MEAAISSRPSAAVATGQVSWMALARYTKAVAEMAMAFTGASFVMTLTI